MNSDATPAPGPRSRRCQPTVRVALGSKQCGAVALIDRAGASSSLPSSSGMDESRQRSRSRRRDDRSAGIATASPSTRLLAQRSAANSMALAHRAVRADPANEGPLPPWTTAGRDAGDSRILTALRERLNCLRRCRRQRGAHVCCGRVRGTSTWLRRGYRSAGQPHCAKEKAGRDDRHPSPRQIEASGLCRAWRTSAS